MRPPILLTSVILSIIVAISLSQAEGTTALTFLDEGTIIIQAINILTVYFIIALAIERGCEAAMDVLGALGVIPPSPPKTAPDPHAAGERKLVSVLICLALAAAISLFGLRLIEMMLQAATGQMIPSEGLNRFVDGLLTALILSGGSEGVHHMLKAIAPQSTLATINHDTKQTGDTR